MTRQLNGTVLGWLMVATFVGCGAPPQSGETTTTALTEDTHESHDHVHEAPHGGQLFELGDHEANIEVVSEPGRLTLFLLDGHAESPVRIADEAIPAELVLEGRSTESVQFLAVAREITGERVGDTSEFALDAPPGELHAVRIPELTLRGAVYRDINLTLHDHD